MIWLLLRLFSWFIFISAWMMILAAMVLVTVACLVIGIVLAIVTVPWDSTNDFVEGLLELPRRMWAAVLNR